MDKGSQFDPTDTRAQGPLKVNAPIKTAEGGYNVPGLPTPPAGYGAKQSVGPMPGGCY
jgi:hypothetical protein